MKKRMSIVTTYVIPVLFVLLLIRYFTHVSSLKDELENSVDSAFKYEGWAELSESIEQLDSTLLAKSYDTALLMYQEAQRASDSCCNQEIEFRIQVAEELIKLSSEIRIIDSIRVMYDTILIAQQTQPGEIRKNDSIQFIIEKANYQIASLKRQLETKSFGEYLTFENKNGTAINYVGEVRDGKANGKGVGLLSTGSRYEGFWKDNMRHGTGSFFWADGQKYRGQYVLDVREGEGTYFWPSGEKYIGNWKNDRRNGQGTFYGEKGEVVATGFWKDDKLINKDK